MLIIHGPALLIEMLTVAVVRLNAFDGCDHALRSLEVNSMDLNYVCMHRETYSFEITSDFLMQACHISGRYSAARTVC
jgi:hypothetical protein